MAKATTKAKTGTKPAKSAATKAAQTTGAKSKPAASPILAAAIESATAAAPTPSVVGDATPTAVNLDLKLRALVDMAVQRSGVKKKDAKPAIEAAMAILGEAIADGRNLNIQPLGKLKINRVKQLPNARVTICKIRQNTNAGFAGAGEGAADAAE